MTSKLDTAGLVERRGDLLSIIRAAAINTAKRPAGLRGPYVFDEAELQALAEALYSASQLSALQERAEAAEEAEDEAKDCFWAIYPEYVRVTGHGISTEAARTALVERAEKAERERDEALTANAELSVLLDKADPNFLVSKLDAAEARVAELLAQINGGKDA